MRRRHTRLVCIQGHSTLFLNFSLVPEEPDQRRVPPLLITVDSHNINSKIFSTRPLTPLQKFEVWSKPRLPIKRAMSNPC